MRSLGAAGIGDQRVRGRVARDLRQNVERGADGQRDVNEIGVLDSGLQLAGENFVGGTQLLGACRGFGSIPGSDVQALRIFAQRQREGTADESGSRECLRDE